MAELVEYRIEECIECLEFIQAKGLFDEDEIKLIISKRKNFEYKLQNTQLTKQHLLKFIAYEQSLLKLLNIRRHSLRDFSNQNEIEHKMVNKIKYLYWKMVTRFSTDLKLWYSFIEFCKEKKLNYTIARIYTNMIRLFNTNEEVWLSAAKWHFEEEHAADVARDLLLQCLRHFPISHKIWHEYFRLECMYASWIYKRLNVFKSEDDHVKSRKRKAIEIAEPNIDIEQSDAIINGAIIKLVFDNAIKKINDINFIIKFIKILDDFDSFLRLPIKEHIFVKLNELFQDKEETIDMNARRWLDHSYFKIHLKLNKNQEFNDFNESRKIYLDGIELVNTEKMHSMFITYLLEYSTKVVNKTNKKLIIDELLIAFDKSWSEEKLNYHLFIEWLLIVKELLPTSDKLRNLISDAINKWPKNVDIWYTVLSIHAENNDVTFQKETQQLFHRAIDHLTKELEENDEEENEKINEKLYTISKKSLKDIWILFINWCLQNNQTHDVLKMIEKYSTLNLKVDANNLIKHKELCYFLKPLLLKLSSITESKTVTSNYFNRYKCSHPILLSFYMTMIKIQLNQPNLNVKYLRDLFKESVEMFGHEDHQLWIKYITFELKNGNPNEVGKIYCLACKKLNTEECDQFTQVYSLIKNDDYVEDDEYDDNDDNLINFNNIKN